MGDGKKEAPIVSVHDLTFIRGDGAFEVVSLLPSPENAAHGIPVGMQLHLDRLAGTCRSLRLPLPHSGPQIAEWVQALGREAGPGSCRFVVTRGNPSKGVDSSIIMLHDAPMEWSTQWSLKSMDAPWHLGYGLPPAHDAPEYGEKVDIGDWKTIKWMSYAPNCLVTRVAQEHGMDDALLLTADGRVLDGPNFAVGFAFGSRLKLIHAGINRMLPSCTQMLVVRAAAEAGLPVEEGCVTLDEAMAADAAFAMSATRHVLPIAALDGRALDVEHDVVRRLQEAYWQLLAADVRSQL